MICSEDWKTIVDVRINMKKKNLSTIIYSALIQLQHCTGMKPKLQPCQAKQNLNVTLLKNPKNIMSD